MTGPIYPPKGAAAEYAAWALNLYHGCPHGCLYCYNTRRMSAEQRAAFASDVHPRPGIIEALERQLPRFAKDHPGAEVFLSFTSDPWPPCESPEGVTRIALRLLDDAGLRIKTLTKAGSLSRRDIGLLAWRPGQHKFGITLTGLDDATAMLWEPRAAPPRERFRTLWRAHSLGIATWISLEPAIYPSLTLQVIKTAGFVNHYAVGKLNHWSLARVRQVDPQAQAVDWPSFRRQVSELLESLGYRRLLDPREPWGPGDKTYYLKRDLVEAR